MIGWIAGILCLLGGAFAVIASVGILRLPDVLTRMQETGPCPSVTVFEECGHAPALARPEDAGLVRRVIGALERA